MGWVMQDPRSPNLAKTAAEFAGVPSSSPGTTFHENCASAGAAIHSLARRILLDEVSLGVAGGVESMSNVARYLYTGRIKNQLYGDMTLVDGLFGALTDVNVGSGELMGLLTERLVERYGVSREEQDEIAYRSHHNALAAWEDGFFDDYVVPVEIPQRRGEPKIVARDEGPRPVTMDELTGARPYFKRDGGTITSLNASSLNDGAAVVLLASAERAAELGLEPLAELRSWHNVGVDREYMGEGAFKVVPPLMQRAAVGFGDVDFFELNEAFAAVLGGAFHDLPDLDPGADQPVGQRDLARSPGRLHRRPPDRRHGAPAPPPGRQGRRHHQLRRRRDRQRRGRQPALNHRNRLILVGPASRRPSPDRLERPAPAVPAGRRHYNSPSESSRKSAPTTRPRR